MAITYQSAGAIAYSAASGSTVAPAYPASIAAGNLLVLVVGQKPTTANGGGVTTPAGWTLVGSLTGAGGYADTLGADTGNTNLYVFTRPAAGGESGSLSVALSDNNVAWAFIARISATIQSWLVAAVTASDISGGSVSLAFGNPGISAGDLLLWAMCIPTDVTTPSQFSAHAISAAGATFGTVTEIAEADSGNGNDIGGFAARAVVSTGAATAGPTVTATAGGTTTNVRGPGILIRIRESAAADQDGAGDLVASASMTLAGASDLAAAGDLTAAAGLTRPGAAPLDGSSNLVATATVTRGGQASLAAAGDATAAGIRTAGGNAALAADGGLLAAGDLISPQPGGTLSADGSLVAAASYIRAGKAQADGNSSLVATAGATRKGTGALDASSNLVATATVTRGGQASLAADSGAAANPGLVRAAAAQLAAGGDLAGLGAIVRGATANLAAIGSLAANGNLAGQLEGRASLSSIGNLVARPLVPRKARGRTVDRPAKHAVLEARPLHTVEGGTAGHQLTGGTTKRQANAGAGRISRR